MSNAHKFCRADHAILLRKVRLRQDDTSLEPLPLRVTYVATAGAIGDCDAFFSALAMEPGLWEFVQHSGADLYRYCGLMKADHERVKKRRGHGLPEALARDEARPSSSAAPPENYL
jgi:hypothetical protein